MPLFDYACANPKCDHVVIDKHSHKCDPDIDPPIHCKKPMQVLIARNRTSMQEFDSFTTNHIHPEGKPITIRNSAELRAVQREYGVYRADDPGIESRGGSFYKKQPKRTYIT